ncbi:MAG: single-stranded DNA-binding protein [Patescibacteria group bacterium]|jgi:single-strand DNA-binding protein|nr:single-stranded DNA-binding protein [Patescibacteria group bacterium]
MNLNKAMIIGNLTRDPETRTTPSGQTVCTFSVATNLIWTDNNGQKQKKAEFHNIVAWRKLGEICSQYLKKGNKVYIEGRLQTRDWEGQDGVKRYRTEIVADNMIMLDTKGSSSSGPDEQPSPIDDFSQPISSADDEIQVENIPF